MFKGRMRHSAARRALAADTQAQGGYWWLAQRRTSLSFHSQSTKGHNFDDRLSAHLPSSRADHGPAKQRSRSGKDQTCDGTNKQSDTGGCGADRLYFSLTEYDVIRHLYLETALSCFVVDSDCPERGEK